MTDLARAGGGAIERKKMPGRPRWGGRACTEERSTESVIESLEGRTMDTSTAIAIALVIVAALPLGALVALALAA